MRVLRSAILAAGVVVVGPGLVAAAPELGLAQKKQVKSVEERLAYYSDALREKCGLATEVDWASFIAAERFDGPGSTIASACQGALQAAAWGCEADADFKAALEAKAERVRCEHVATREATGLSFDAAKKSLVFRVQISDTGAGAAPASYFALEHTAARRWLDKNL
jgi:hypothetical protein